MKYSTIEYNPSTDFVYVGEESNGSTEGPNVKPRLPPIVDAELSSSFRGKVEEKTITQQSGEDIQVDNNDVLETLRGTVWRPDEAPINKRNFKYEPCQPNPDFTQLKFVTTEYTGLSDPSGFSVADKSDSVYLVNDIVNSGLDQNRNNETCVALSQDGWRTIRSNSCIKEGAVYMEIEVIDVDVNKGKNIRFGISRREASLEAPVGYDAYGYGLRDKTMESIFSGKLHQLLPEQQLSKGDVIGLLVHLPSLDKQIQQANEYTKFKVAEWNKTRENFNKLNVPKSNTKLHNKMLHEEFEKELLENCDPGNIIRDQIAIRYKSMLLFESTDYLKEDVSLNEHEKKKKNPNNNSKKRTHREANLTILKTDGSEDIAGSSGIEGNTLDRHLEFDVLEDSYVKVFLNGECLGDAFRGLKPVLPPFSQLKYNDKLYYQYWKTGKASDERGEQSYQNDMNNFSSSSSKSVTPVGDGINSNFEEMSLGLSGGQHAITGKLSHTKSKGTILKNKYCNNNRLGYYPTVSSFNEGSAKLVTSKKNLKFWEKVRALVPEDLQIQTLEDVYAKQVADDIVWDIIDEVELEAIYS